MKTISNNIYPRLISFQKKSKYQNFVSEFRYHKLFLDDSFGDTYYCLITHNSLTREPVGMIAFQSDTPPENIELVTWQAKQLFVVYTGSIIALIHSEITLQHTSIDILTPLIGMYITHKENLFVLEEGAAHLINSGGKIIEQKLFTSIDTYCLDTNGVLLTIDGKTEHFGF